jgi:hypothetical protein
MRLDHPEVNPPGWDKWITTRLDDGQVKFGELPMEYWGDFETNYSAHCCLNSSGRR